MNDIQNDFTEFHWMMDMLQNVDVGLVILDRRYRIKMWNGFMESHSGLLPSHVRDKSLFSLFPEIPKDWFKRKAEPVFLLKNRAFTIWEQKSYLFKFLNYRPITGVEPYMYQNVTLSPIPSADGQVNNICLMIYDVTDVALKKRELDAVKVKLCEAGIE